MTWLSWPVAAVAGAVLIPLLVLLYFLKLKRRDVEISTTLLWKQTIKDMQANAPFQKLRRNLLLFLQLLVLIAGLLAIAQPQMSTDLSPPGRSVILIDRSASMLASDADDGRGGTTTRLEATRREALAFIDAMNTGGIMEDAANLFGTRDPDEAMVIAFDSGAEVIQPFTSNRDLLRRAIEGIEPTHAGSRIGEGIKLASAYVGPRLIEDRGLVAGAPVVIWSDGAIADLADVSLHPETEVRYNRVGTGGSSNVGITAMRAERTYDRPDEVSVFVGLQSTATEQRSIDVEFIVDGVVRSVRAVTVAGRESDSGVPGTGGVVFKLDRPEGAVLGARLVTDPAWDVLAPDNESWFVLKPAKRLAVALVTEGNMVLRHALSGLTLSRLATMTPAEFESLARAGRADEFDVFILDGWAPREDIGGQGLPGGKYLVFGATPRLGSLKIGEQPGERRSVNAIVNWDREHPALRAIDLSAVRIGKVSPLELEAGARAIATSTSGPAIVEVVEAGVRAIVVTFGITDSNWPLDWGFVIFLASSIRTLGEDLGDEEGLVVRPGEVISTDVPRSVESVRLEGPGVSGQRLTPDGAGRVVFGPVERSGVYSLRWSGDAGTSDVRVGGDVVRAMAVSMQDPVESRVESRAALELTRGDVEAVAREEGARERSTRLWPWILLGAAGLLMLEWWVYNRRVYL